MKFEPFNFDADAAAAIQDFLLTSEGRKLPQDVQDKAWELIRPGGSLIFAVCYFAELIFARKDVKSKPAMMIAAACADMASKKGVDLIVGERGRQISQALRRRAGEKPAKGTRWPSAKDDPEPLLQMTKAFKEAAKAASEGLPKAQPLAA